MNQQPGRDRPKPKRRPIVRIGRKLLVPALSFAALVAGLIVGYAVVGKQPVADVFRWSTWQHMLDLIFADN